MQFTKPPKSFQEQIGILESRGMIISDHGSAAHYLSHLNYYRLRGYWLPFEADQKAHSFKSGVTFDDVLNLYIFDRELRLLALDAIERIEVSLRTQWAYHLARLHGPHAYLNAGLSKNPRWHANNLSSLMKELERSDEVFVSHYNETYSVPESPPVWAVCEVMSLGLLSRWYKSLRPASTRTAIARTYDLPDRVLESFVEHMAYIRNICAHHSRLWNRRMTKTMELPRTKPKGLSANFDHQQERKLYNTLVMIAYFMDMISPDHHWKKRLFHLLEEHKIDARAMGFPTDWQSRSIWQS
ncbi:Abi family protein [Sedimenticola selenatireducens]|uniref:Abi family protein n=1 Tax=Sedimenticola selenatireducens TaxID=191960 RepID=UPI0021B2F10D|nr:Abi family protein [Sedimenticola selenatireducens]